MLDDYQLPPFVTAKAQAEARRQQTIREAHEAFARAYLLEKARHAAEYERASAGWDAVKSNPSAKGYDVAWRAFQDAKLPADHTQARAELDRAIKAADAAYHKEVARSTKPPTTANDRPRAMVSAIHLGRSVWAARPNDGA